MNEKINYQEHHFNPEYAEKYGLVEAILLHNIIHWITVNKTNKINFHDNKTWTFNSLNAYDIQYVYLSIKQIRRALDSLKEQNIIITGNYNKLKFDKTSWYALVDEKLFIAQKVLSICQKEPIGVPPGANGQATEGLTIPYNSPYNIQTDNIPYNNKDNTNIVSDSVNNDKERNITFETDINTTPVESNVSSEELYNNGDFESIKKRILSPPEQGFSRSETKLNYESRYTPHFSSFEQQLMKG